MDQLHPQIYRVAAPFGNGVVQIYVLVGRQIALIDTGVQDTVPRYVEPALAELNLKLSDVDWVLNTHAHPDHSGGNAYVKAGSNASFAVHSADVPTTKGPESFMRSPHDISQLVRLAGRPDLVETRRAFLQANVGDEVVPDRLLQDGDEIDLGRGLVLRAIHTPGHTPGATSFYWEREELLLCGDSFQVRGSNAGWMPLYFYADEYMRSCERVAEVPIKTIAMAHGYQSGRWENVPVRHGRAAVDVARESLQVSRLIDGAVAKVLADGAPADFLAFTKTVLAELQYDLPVVLDRDLGVGLHSLASIHAHYERQTGRQWTGLA
ncbi:MAG: MBL fold metallo-hydrolase [Chloroflexota bacterium]